MRRFLDIQRTALIIVRIFDLNYGREMLPVRYYRSHSDRAYTWRTNARNNHQYYMNRRFIKDKET